MSKAPEPASKSGMALPQLKQIMSKGTRDLPMRAAFGLGKEKGFALLLVEKGGTPKKLSESLTEMFPEAKEVRWGLVFSDSDEPDIAKFRINKPANGLGKKLVKTLKGTGFTEVVFLEDEGDILDKAADKVIGGSKGEADEEEGGEVQTQEEPQSGVAPPPPSPTGPAPGPSTPLYDPTELHNLLATLIPRIGPAGIAHPDHLERLKQLATLSNVNLKSNNLKTAADAIHALSNTLDAIEKMPKAQPTAPKTPTPPPPDPTAGSVAYGKARLIWVATHKKITSDVELLCKELVSYYNAEKVAIDIETRYREVVSPLITTYDESLADKLDEATNATDPALRSKLVGEAREIIETYKAALSNPIIADLDSNPFVPLSIQKTLSTTLAGLSGVIR